MAANEVKFRIGLYNTARSKEKMPAIKAGLEDLLQRKELRNKVTLHLHKNFAGYQILGITDPKTYKILFNTEIYRHPQKGWIPRELARFPDGAVDDPSNITVSIMNEKMQHRSVADRKLVYGV